MILSSGYYKKMTAILIFLMTVVFFSCKNNDMEVIKALGDPKTVPQLTMINPEILHYSSSRLQARVRAPEILRFERAASPYMEFPKGITIDFYDENLQMKGHIRANYARYEEKKQLWEARYDVEAVNDLGDKLNTEQLFWNEASQKIYSEKFTKITNSEGVFIGEGGFTANQENGNFTGWTLYSSKGRVSIRDTMQPDSTGTGIPDPGLMAVDSLPSVPQGQEMIPVPSDSAGIPEESEFSTLRKRYPGRLSRSNDSIRSIPR